MRLRTHLHIITMDPNMRNLIKIRLFIFNVIRIKHEIQWHGWKYSITNQFTRLIISLFSVFNTLNMHSQARLNFSIYTIKINRRTHKTGNYISSATHASYVSIRNRMDIPIKLNRQWTASRSHESELMFFCSVLHVF
eukprot:NODE_202_length_13094_cov_1.571528.p11 type:complete len:137 gc:universal NODE_202_length_13094_cov_1.571528:5592-5182(-)